MQPVMKLALKYTQKIHIKICLIYLSQLHAEHLHVSNTVVRVDMQDGVGSGGKGRLIEG
jgi:hypothetical protein